ncbi:MAG: phage/plasmid primase, P4 family [Chloroflexota bacterium]
MSQANETQDNRIHKPTDDQIGDMLMADWEGRVAYFFGQWQAYSGGVWSPMAETQFERRIWDKLKALKANGIKPGAHKVSSVTKYLRAYLWVDDQKIDRDPNTINLKNGLFNIETTQLEKHRREIFSTSQLPFDYDPDADCPHFRQFAETVLVNPNSHEVDPELRYLVWEALGYSLTASTEHRVSFWLVGESATGKSVLINVLQALAGSSHVSIDLDTLSSNPYQIADVAGKRVVTFTEPRANAVLADNHYKRLVSQDTISTRQIYGKPFSFRPMCKVWGAMNETPRVIDRSDAIFNRVMILPMNHVIPENQRDRQLTDKLLSELAGIFNIALIGLKRLKHSGEFTVCTQSLSARQEYKAENDIESAFVADWCIRDPQSKVRGQQLYDAYNSWCRRNGAFPKSSVKVARDWTRLGFKKIRSNGIWYQGVRLNEIGASHVSR